MAMMVSAETPARISICKVTTVGLQDAASAQQGIEA